MSLLLSKSTLTLKYFLVNFSKEVSFELELSLCISIIKLHFFNFLRIVSEKKLYSSPSMSHNMTVLDNSKS